MGWNEWKNKVFLKYLYWQTRPAKIKRYIRKKQRVQPLTTRDEFEKKNKIKVAAIQLKMTLYNDIEIFIDKMDSLIYQAVVEGSQLLAFPEDNLTQLMGLLPGIVDKGNRGEQNNLDHQDYQGVPQNKEKDIADLLAELGSDIKIVDIFSYIGPVIEKAVLNIFSLLAEKYQIYIMAGSGMLPEADGKIYNKSYLFSPQGELLGEQKKLHLLPLEEEWGLSTGEELQVITTGIGKLAIPVCMDATYFETFRIAVNKGAQIVMIPIANLDEDYNYWTAMRGIWGRVQESNIYGIKSAMVGDFLGFKFTGQSGIYAPIELTPEDDGILAEARSFDQEEIVYAELDLDLLDFPEPIPQKRGIWETCFPEIYTKINEVKK